MRALSAIVVLITDALDYSSLRAVKPKLNHETWKIKRVGIKETGRRNYSTAVEPEHEPDCVACSAVVTHVSETSYISTPEPTNTHILPAETTG